MFSRMAYSVGHRAKSIGRRANDTTAVMPAKPSALCSTPYAHRCPLCGKQFRAEEATQCAACALAQKCGMVMCPNCGYEFVA